jgi:peptide/nickel transport system substrate-binding protein
MTKIRAIDTGSRRVAILVLSIAIGACMAVGIAACGSSGDAEPASGAGEAVDTTAVSKGGTLRLARSIEPVTLNPVVCECENGSLQVMAQIYDQLIEFMPGSEAPEPGLATDWDVSPDKKTFTFHLRPAKFSDGTPVTSEDVKYTLERIKIPTNNYYTLYGLMKSVTTPDPSTVVVTLSRPTIGFPYYLGFPEASIVPKDTVEEVGDNAFGQHPIGSGAFMLKRWVKGTVVELVKNPYYWREGQPYLDKVELLYAPNDNTRTLDLISGNVDAVDAIPYSQVEQVENSGEATVLFQLSSGMYPIWLNEKVAPLDEKVVRQALNYATPLEQIRSVVFHDRSELANAAMPKLKYWSDGVKPYPYDPGKAKELLAKSSQPEGFDLKLTLIAGDETSKQIAQIVQEAWGELGIDVSLQQTDFGTLYERAANGDTEASMFLPDILTSDIPIPDEFAQGLFNTLNEPFHNGWTWYDNPTAAKLADEATHAPDEATQEQLFQELQRVTMEDPPSVPLIFPQYRPAFRSNVHGYQYVQTGWWRLEQVSVDP